MLNNPLRLTDPTGLVGEAHELGNAAGEEQKKKPPPRIIYMFIGFEQSEQRTYEVDRNGQATNRGTTPPDFAGLQAQAKRQGVDLRIVTGSDVNVENLTTALQDASAYAVVFIGHGYTSNDQWHGGLFDSKFPFIPNQGVETSDGPSNPNGAIDVNAQNVAIFTCESEFSNTLLTQGDGNQSYIGVYSGATSGSDGLTQTGSLSRAGFAAAQQFVNGKGPDAAVKAANGALMAAPMVGREALLNPTTDKGDYVKRIR